MSAPILSRSFMACPWAAPFPLSLYVALFSLRCHKLAYVPFAHWPAPHVPAAGLNSFEALQSAEVNEFRRNMRAFCTRIADERAEWPPLEQIKYRYPARIDRCLAHFPPLHMADRVTKDTVFEAHILLENDVGTAALLSIAMTKPQ